MIQYVYQFSNTDVVQSNDIASSTVYSVDSSALLLELFDKIDASLNVQLEYEFVNTLKDEKSVKEMVKGYVIKFLKQDTNIIVNKKSAYGDQTFNSGDVSNNVHDYRAFSLDGTSDVHVLSKVSQNQNDLRQRDQLLDFHHNDASFDSIGKPLPLMNSFDKVLALYSTEVALDSYALEVIIANIRFGDTNLNSDENQSLLTKWRAYPGIKAIIVNDSWFLENIGTYDTDFINYAFCDYSSQGINVFNAAFYNTSKTTGFVCPVTPDGLTSGLGKKIVKYGQVIGGVVAESIELARYVSEILSKELQHNEASPSDISNDSLELLEFDNSGASLKLGSLSDHNTMSRITTQSFGASVAKMCGPTKFIDDSCFNTLFNDGVIQGLQPIPQAPGFYIGYDGISRIMPNYKNESKGQYFATGEYKDTLGNGTNINNWNPGTNNIYLNNGALTGFNTPDFGISQNGQVVFPDTNNSYMDNSYNNNNFLNDPLFGDYGGTFSSVSQASIPLEPVSFTVDYDAGNVMNIRNGFQDYVAIANREVFKKLHPAYRSLFYDASGQLEATNTHDKFHFKAYASGGSFGSKFIAKVANRTEIAMIATMFLRKPIKYIEYWKFGEQSWMGRYNSIERSTMKVDRNKNIIKSMARDVYHIVDKNSVAAGVGLCAAIEAGVKLNFIQNYATRGTLVHQHIGQQFPQRGFEQVEGVFLHHMNMSKASALLDIPHYELVLKHLTYVGNRYNVYTKFPDTSPKIPGQPAVSIPNDNPDISNLDIREAIGINNSPINSGLLNDANTCKEFTIKEMLIGILKNLEKHTSADLSLNDLSSAIVSKDSIIGSFNNYYKEEVQKFNNANKFKKRGMAIVPSKYGVVGGFNISTQCRLSLNYNDNKVRLNFGVIDHGTGSYCKGIQVAAEVLKIDTDLITYISEGDWGGMNHIGSTSNVGIARAVTSGSKKLLQEMLKKYPINRSYQGDISCNRFFNYKTVTVDGITFYLDNDNKLSINTSVDISMTDTSFNYLGKQYYLDVSSGNYPGLPPYNGPVFTDENLSDLVGSFSVTPKSFTLKTVTVDLDTSLNGNFIDIHGYNYNVVDNSFNLHEKSGAEVVEIFEELNKERSRVLYGNVIRNVKLPDLHKEIILRTLEFEYQKPAFGLGEP